MSAKTRLLIFLSGSPGLAIPCTMEQKELEDEMHRACTVEASGGVAKIRTPEDSIYLPVKNLVMWRIGIWSEPSDIAIAKPAIVDPVTGKPMKVMQ